MSLEPALITRAQAGAFIDRLHRHHDADQGDRFVLGCWDTDRNTLCGVAVVGNPRARMLARLPWLLEVTRLCTDGTRNACSWLYRRATEVAEARGFTAVITYTLKSEGGASLRALGWWPEDIGGDSASWANRPGRRTDHVRADFRWLWLSRYGFHSLPEATEKSPQLSLPELEQAMSAREVA